jgi:hypothetical protein
MSSGFEQLKRDLISELGKYQIGNASEMGTTEADFLIKTDPQRYISMSPKSLAMAFAFIYGKGNYNYEPNDFTERGVGYYIISKRYDWNKIAEDKRAGVILSLVATIIRYVDNIAIIKGIKPL